MKQRNDGIQSSRFLVVLDWFRIQFGHPGGTFLVSVGICLASALFVWVDLPETKGKKSKEIGEMWLRPHSVNGLSDAG
jgi:hypothetical protein